MNIQTAKRWNRDCIATKSKWGESTLEEGRYKNKDYEIDRHKQFMNREYYFAFILKYI